MTRLAKSFDALRSQGRKALVVYLTAGDPDFDTFLAAATAAIDEGADVLEIGVPFSDPVADGPVIQRAMGRALAAGGGFDQALRGVRALRERGQTVWYMNALNEGHGYEKKENRDIYQQVTFMFLQKYLLGQ